MADNLKIKASKHFYLHEITYPGTVHEGTKRYFDPGYFDGIDFIREFFGAPITANNWGWGGRLRYRGLRPFNCRVGSKKSQHKYGRGFDFNVKGLSSNQVRDKIMDNQKLFIKNGWTTIEHKDFAPNWCHLDRRWTGMDEMKIVKP